MKTFAILASLAATALAQNVFVNLPEGNELPAGGEVTIQVSRPNSLTGSREIGIAIGIQSCPTNGCLPSTSVLGVELYTGLFQPDYHGTGGAGVPYENFTVTIPEDTVEGQAVVGVAHASLVGAANWPFFEVVNTTATVV
ncbi:hypothetical protein BDW59DRAFT_139871 [Aspergillus cavernicola]|uniref:Uncharacterized protein n=1 Tax=Aspergillus cavernicola TaxID=176166 RepID=A0ABR4IVC3_9EURO